MPVSTPRATSWSDLHALYEASSYKEALELVDRSGLLAALEEDAESPELAGPALTVANLYRDLGHFGAAEAHYLHGLALLAAGGKDRPAYAAALADLADLYERLGRWPQALELYTSARAAHQAAPQPDEVAHAGCLHDLGRLLKVLGRRREAVDCLTEARARLEQASSPPQATAHLLLEEATVFGYIKGPLDAARRVREAVILNRQHRGDGHAETAHARHVLGRMSLALYEFDEAAEHLGAAERWTRQAWGEDHPRFAGVLESLALLRAARGQAREAEALARRGLALTQSALGDRHVGAADSHRTLGKVLLMARQVAAAGECFEQAREIAAERLGDNHPMLAEVQLDLADAREAAGRRHDAVELTRQALAQLDCHPDDVRHERMAACLALARLTASAGDMAEAAALADRAAALAAELGDDPLLSAPAALLRAHLEAGRGEVAAAAERLEATSRSLALLHPQHPLRAECDVLRAELARMVGQPERAARLAREAVSRAERGPGSPGLPKALRFLAEQLHQSGDLTGAEAVFERALEVERRLRGPEHLDLVPTLRGLARLCLSRGNPQGAEVRFRQALEVRRGALGDRHPDTAESLADLASLAHQAGDLAAAEALYRQSREVRAGCLGEHHPETVASVNGLAWVVWARGDTAGAADLLEKALAPLEEGHPGREPLRHTLGLVCASRGEAARAMQLLGQVRAAYEKALGGSHDGLVPILGDLARVHAGLGDHLEARRLLERIRAIHASSPFPQPLAEAADLVSLSDSYRALHDLDRAGELAGRALSLARGCLCGEPGLLSYLVHAAGDCRGRRRFREAAGLLAEAEALVRRLGGERHPFMAGVWTEQAVLESARGRPGRARPLYARAADLARLSLGEDHPDHAGARRALGLHLQAQGNHADAEAQLRACVDITRRTAGADHPAVALASQALAELHRARGDWPAAEAECRASLDIIRRSEHPVDALHASHLHALGVLQRLQGRFDQAAEMFHQVLAIDRESGGGEGTDNLGTHGELALVEAARGEAAAALRRLLRVLAAYGELARAFGCLPAWPGRDALLAAPWGVVEQALTLAPRAPELAEEVLTEVLRWHAMPQAELVVGDRAELRRRHRDDAEALDRLFDLNLQIAGRQMAGAGPEGLATHRELLARWGAERDQLEEGLAARVPALARLRAWRAAGPAAVRAALPPGGVLVELVRFAPRDFAEMCAGRAGLLPPRYLVFVLQAGEEGVEVLDAGEVEGRGGAERLRALLAPHLGDALVVGHGGRLKPSACAGLAPGAQVRAVRSGREVASPLLAPAARGWVEWLRAWVGLPAG